MIIDKIKKFVKENKRTRLIDIYRFMNSLQDDKYEVCSIYGYDKKWIMNYGYFPFVITSKDEEDTYNFELYNVEFRINVVNDKNGLVDILGVGF